MSNLGKLDVLIVGAGVIGCSMARKLSLYDLEVAVLEKSSYVCSGQSKANGAIIHGGHNSRPGTLKAKLNVQGNKMFSAFCDSLGVEFCNTGLLVIAINQKEKKILKDLYQQGVTNGVEDLKILDRQQLTKFEPNISPNALGALFVPSAGIVDVHRLVIGLAEHSAINGTSFYLNHEVLALESESDLIKVTTNKDTFLAKIVINCAGVNSAKIANSVDGQEYEILPRKGEYYILDKKYNGMIKHPCFPVPTPHGKGVVVFPTINGNIVFGGNSILTQNTSDYSTTEEGFTEVFTKGKKLVPGIEGKELITGFAGIRSTSVNHDFVIEYSNKIEGLINLVGIDSPGLSSAPAIVDYVMNLIESKSLIPLKSDVNKQQRYIIKPLFRDLDDKSKQRWLAEDKSFGRIICRCEEITEGDIISAIHSPIPATTIDAIKFKTWTGAGRCQGAFDLERVMEIMERETGISPTSINKNSPGSTIVINETKVVHG